MDYEKAYNNLFLRLKAWYDLQSKCTKEAFESIFPELKESEDERMLREIKRYIKEQGDKPTGLPNGTAAVADMIAWLEKQKVSTDIVKDKNVPISTVCNETTEEMIKQMILLSLQKDIMATKNSGCSTTDLEKCVTWLEKQGNLMGALQEANKKIGELVEENYYLKEEQKGKLVLTPEAYERVLKLGKKQGEQKPIDKVEPKFHEGDSIQFKGFGHDRYTIKEVCGLSHYINTMGDRMDMSYTDANFEVIKDSDKVKLSPAWSEEDDQYLLVCKNALAKYQASDKWDAEIISHWLENKLKAPQNTWKPSEYHLKSLQAAIGIVGELTLTGTDLKELLEQLKKLMEE